MVITQELVTESPAAQVPVITNTVHFLCVFKYIYVYIFLFLI